MKILTVKEYLEQQQLLKDDMSVEGISEKLTKQFADFINTMNNPQILFNKDEQCCHCRNMQAKFQYEKDFKFLNIPDFPKFEFPVASLYGELIDLIDTNEWMNQIVVKKLEVTPLMYNTENFTPERGVMAYITIK